MIEYTCPDGCSHILELVKLSICLDHGVMVATGTMLVDGRRCPYRQALTVAQINEFTDLLNLTLNPVTSLGGSPGS